MLHPLNKPEDSGKKAAVCQPSPGIIAVDRNAVNQENLAPHLLPEKQLSCQHEASGTTLWLRTSTVLQGDHQHLKPEPRPLQNKAWLYHLSILSGPPCGPRLLVLDGLMPDGPWLLWLLWLLSLKLLSSSTYNLAPANFLP